LLVCLGVVMAQPWMSNSPHADYAPGDIAQIRLPAGFKIEYYARNVANARQIVLSGADPTLLYVGSRTDGTINVVVNKSQVVRVLSGLHMPNGVAWRNGSLYVAETTRVLRYDNIDATYRSPKAPVVVIDKLPVTNRDWHAWKYLKFGPDGALYIPNGAPCNFCLKSSPPGDPVTDITKAPYATIGRVKPGTSTMEIVATGIRNSVGFDWHPTTRAFWFTDNGRDNWGNEKPHDELNVVTKPIPENFGFPFCYGSGTNATSGGNDPQFYTGSCDSSKQSTYTGATWELGPHVAATGMIFYTGSMFPSHYQNAAIIAEHGSWNRPVGQHTGYRIHTVFLDSTGTKVTGEEILADGWLNSDHQTKWGRPSDVLMLPDGSLLVSDDYNNAIYRITYAHPDSA